MSDPLSAPEKPDPASDADAAPPGRAKRHGSIESYVRRKLWNVLLGILALVACVAALSIYYRDELDALTSWVFERVGLGGVMGLLFLSDAVLSPLPPDAILVLISKSPYHESWPALIPALGVLSTVAGWIGYFIGQRLAQSGLPRRLFRGIDRQEAAVINRYGPWGIVLGALTPMPFSVTCWTAGMLNIPFRLVAWPCLLRVPRFVLYYLVITHAEALVRGGLNQFGW